VIITAQQLTQKKMKIEQSGAPTFQTGITSLPYYNNKNSHKTQKEKIIS